MPSRRRRAARRSARQLPGSAGWPVTSAASLGPVRSEGARACARPGRSGPRGTPRRRPRAAP
eukprot:13014044-Alexandrium_andersonii.AAC.1